MSDIIIGRYVSKDAYIGVKGYGKEGDFVCYDGKRKGKRGETAFGKNVYDRVECVCFYTCGVGDIDDAGDKQTTGNCASGKLCRACQRGNAAADEAGTDRKSE